MSIISVTPLGTVSPYCKRGKNCPGFLIQNGINKILLDCGNGISRYLNFPEDLNNLNIIISHLHKDHYSDLGSLAYASYVYKKMGYINDRIKVFIPQDEKKDIKSNGEWTSFSPLRKSLIDCEYLMNFKEESFLEFIPYKENLKLSYGELNVSFSKNPHNLITYSTKLETEDFTIIYSGDTGYRNNSLISFAEGADLLICESSYLKGQKRDKDYHLYAYEAGMIARDANVKKLLLTHFWPEIDKQKYVDEAKEYFSYVEAAEEGKKLVLRRK